MPKKLTIEDVNARLSPRGIKAVLFKGTGCSGVFECDQGHKWRTLASSVLTKSGCPICFQTRRTLTLEQVNKILEPRNIRALKYDGSLVDTIFECSEGHRWTAKPNNVIHKSGCPKCANALRKGRPELTLEDVNDRVNDRGIRAITYDGMQSKARFECDKGHQWTVLASTVLQGGGCPDCSAFQRGRKGLTLDLVNERLHLRGIKALSYEAAQIKSSFQCSKGHVWEARPNTVLSGSGCPHCAGKARLNLLTLNARLSERGIRVVSFTGSTMGKGIFECQEGHEWEARVNNVLGGKGCPHCKKGNFNLSLPAVTYFLRLRKGKDEVFKVGVTNRDTKQRIWNLETEADKIELLGELSFDCGEDAVAMEKYLHSKYDAYRLSAEEGKDWVGNGHTELFYVNVWILENSV